VLVVRPGKWPDIASGGGIGDDAEIPSAPTVIRVIGSHLSWPCPDSPVRVGARPTSGSAVLRTGSDRCSMWRGQPELIQRTSAGARRGRRRRPIEDRVCLAPAPALRRRLTAPRAPGRG